MRGRSSSAWAHPPTSPNDSPPSRSTAEKIPHRFAIAAKEVTFEQGQPYSSLALQDAEIKQYGLTPGHPIIAVSWFDAAAYCNG